MILFMFYFDIFKVPLPNLKDTYEKQYKTVQHQIRSFVTMYAEEK